MKSRKTHNRITKALLPDLDPKVIDKVNKAIDKPELFTHNNGVSRQFERHKDEMI